MLPDSNTAKYFNLHQTKMLYIINHGIAPYFKSTILETFKKFSVYRLPFYKSVTTLVQDCEILMMVRYWNYGTYRAIDPYLEFSFLNHSKIIVTSITLCDT